MQDAAVFRTYTHLTDTPIRLSPGEKARIADILSRPVVPGGNAPPPGRDPGKRPAGAVIPGWVIRAKVLRMLDRQDGAPKPKAKAIAAALGCSAETVRSIGRIYCQGGLDAVFSRKPFVKPQTVLPAVETAIRALSREPPPPPADRWTHRSLAEEAVKRGIVEHISTPTMSRILSKGTGAALRPVILSAAEQKRLEATLRSPDKPHRDKLRASVLLHLAQGFSGKPPGAPTDEETAWHCICPAALVSAVRRRFSEAGVEGALADRQG
jgi:hypothetical protein